LTSLWPDLNIWLELTVWPGLTSLTVQSWQLLLSPILGFHSHTLLQQICYVMMVAAAVFWRRRHDSGSADLCWRTQCRCGAGPGAWSCHGWCASPLLWLTVARIQRYNGSCWDREAWWWWFWLAVCERFWWCCNAAGTVVIVARSLLLRGGLSSLVWWFPLLCWCRAIPASMVRVSNGGEWRCARWKMIPWWLFEQLVRIWICYGSETWCSTPLFSGDMVGVVGAAMEFAQICSSEDGGCRGQIGCCRDEKWKYNRCVKKRTRFA